MASSMPPDEGFMQRMLECPVCLFQYNTSDRLPKGLRCHHTACAACISSLESDGNIQCPKCRNLTVLEEVGTNYSLTDILSALCEECFSKERANNCHHCNKILCVVCLEKHLKPLHGDIHKELQALSDELSSCMDLSRDPTAVKVEGSRAADIIRQIMVNFRRHRDAVAESEKKVIERVNHLRDRNIQSYSAWRENLEAVTTKCKTFSDQSRSQLGEQYSANVSAEDMSKMLLECRQMLQDLTQAKKQDVLKIDYALETSDFSLNEVIQGLGKIAITCKFSTDSSAQEMAILKPTIPSAFDDADRGRPLKQKSVDYKLAEVAQTVGRLGSQTGQFNKPWGIVQSSDGHIIITDTHNHRIKVYNHNLRFVRIIGQKGSQKTDFNQPSGIAIGKDDKIFVSDFNNCRIQVCTINGEFLYNFGTKGNENGQLANPLGLLVFNELLYVCDAENHRVQIFRLDGAFVSIFPKVFTTTRPFSIAAMNDQKILVTEQAVSIHVFTPNGTYLNIIPTALPQWMQPFQPVCITTDTKEHIIITDAQQSIKVFDEEGTFFLQISSKEDPLDNPRHLTLDQHGDILVVDHGNNRIVKFQVCYKE